MAEELDTSWFDLKNYDSIVDFGLREWERQLSLRSFIWRNSDNDTRTPGNPGMTKAAEAAEAVAGSVAAPPIHGDFNDYAIFLKEAANDHA